MNLLHEHFDFAVETPDGIAKLRGLILTLAMQGKLVPQDLNDQPASELLKEIEAEKKRLVKERKIKEQKPLPPIKQQEIPYPLPKGWCFVHLIDIGTWAVGSGFPMRIQGDRTQDIFLCKVSDMNLPGNEKYINSANNTVSKEVATRLKINVHEAGTVIFPKIGGAIATNKRRILSRKTAIDNNCLGIRPYDSIDLGWVYQLLRSYDFSQYQLGTSVPALSQGTIGSLVVGLPPFSEQTRIVSKIGQLMSLCDKLEAQRNERDKKRLTVHASAMSGLLNASDKPAFNRSWSFITRHFNELYSVTENVAELKKAILQLAVMGKLVPQDPNDQPASELLKDIEVEKKRLVKEGKVKEQKPLPPIKEEEIPFELPYGWEWVRLGNVVSLLGDGIHGTPAFDVSGDFYFINGNNLSDGRIEIKESTKTVSDGEYKKHKKELNAHSVLVSINGTIGNVAFYNHEKVILGKSACYFNLFEQIDKRYVKNVINSEYFLTYAFSRATGSTIKNVSLMAMRELPMPLPPFPEQGRVVAKIDQLMALAGKLDEQLSSASARRTAILDAVLARV